MQTLIKKIDILGLYNNRNFSVVFKDNTLILVGENGSGKTTISRIIYAVLSCNWDLLNNYPFKKIVVYFGNDTIEISENVITDIYRIQDIDMQSGTFKFRYNLLGYRKGEDGEPEIVEEEAKYIRAIFNMYLDGKSLDQIKSYLEGEGVLTKTGKNVWNKCIIQAILTNERYCGDLLMQKTFTENCITKKVKKNRGEMPKYLIRDNHPAIITHATFKMA